MNVIGGDTSEGDTSNYPKKITPQKIIFQGVTFPYKTKFKYKLSQKKQTAGADSLPYSSIPGETARPKTIYGLLTP